MQESKKEELLPSAEVIQEDAVLQVVTVETLPVIKEKIKEFGAEVTVRLSNLGIENIQPTEDNLKAITDLHAALNGEFKEFESQRKAVKTKITAPLTDMEATYKESLAAPYKKALGKLKDLQAVVVESLLQIKEDTLSKHFAEYVISEGLEYLNWAKYKKLTNLNLIRSKSDKRYMKEIDVFIQSVKSDLELIKSEEYQAEILTEYKRSFNCSEAILAVKSRKKAEQEEEDRIREEQLNKRLKSFISLGFELNEDRTKFVHKDVESEVEWKDIAEASSSDYLKLYNENKAVINALKVQKATDQIKEEKELVAQEEKVEQEQAPAVFAAPVEKQEPMESKLVMEFRVIDTIDNLRRIKQFLVDNNINFEKIV